MLPGLTETNAVGTPSSSPSPISSSVWCESERTRGGSSERKSGVDAERGLSVTSHSIDEDTGGSLYCSAA